MTTATEGATPGETETNLHFTFEFRNSVQYAYRSKNLPKLNMHRQRSIPKELYQKLAIAFRVLRNTKNLVISCCCFAEDGKEN